VSDEELRHLYARCRAFLMPGEEDFGIAAVEALASGKPVIALGRGGALETVPTNAPLGGLLYSHSGDDSLRDAVERWDRLEERVIAADLQRYAMKYSEAEFSRSMRAVLFRERSEMVSPKRFTTAGNL
jgi:glycosyltransferase involved in cell wall biosynthesis